MQNKDDLFRAVYGLDIFTKNWCMNCKQTEVNNHKCNYPLEDFGSMGEDWYAKFS